MSKASVENRLAQLRKSRGIAAADLARRVNVSRQTIYAIEAGTYIPNTEVALHLAEALEVTVDELFSLRSSAHRSPDSLTAEVLSDEVPFDGQAVRVCQVGSKWLSVPVPGIATFLPEADGVVRRGGRARNRAELSVFSKTDAASKRLLLAGCDPAMSLVSSIVGRVAGVDLVSAAASSKRALAWLKQGKVHIAGSHLQDPASGEFNIPYIREHLAGEELLIVTFAHWEEGFVVRSGNPKCIRKADDLGRRGVRLVNREPGSGSRALLDRLIGDAGLTSAKVDGYERIALGHLPAAFQVLSEGADACIATRSAARTFGLDFIPVQGARYDLVMRKRTSELPAVKAFLDVLHRATLRRKLEVLAGYDTSQTGAVVPV
ncbi:MAG TPA: substrate-binding domain-containing protein [Bryobacteraceae bacterium]|nr:substrate-binding domain-containing protein [Bryobacteraceae bacterium]